VVVWLGAVYERTRRKYGERAYRYVHLDAGHVSENLLLEATALGLGACCVGAFYDEDANEFLGLDGGREFAVLAVAVGWVRD
jgi:SagB-type dehydrogenase family enzyme